MHHRPLLEDGSLALEADPALLPALARWLPLLPHDGASAAAGALLRVEPADDTPSPPLPSTRRTLALGGVDVWVEGDVATLAGPLGLRGSIELVRARGELRAPPAGHDAESASWELYSACTLASALLLGRLGRALAHAAAVAPPGGGAWLLVGDTHSGKTTTCANLLRAGWSYLSDDHLVLGRESGAAVGVEGWPRPFHLDEGWERGETLGRRGETDPRGRWPGGWRRRAPVAGLLFPRIEAARPTVLEPIAPADALAALLRQSPWLLADPAAAPALLALLRDASLLPARSLRLGRDAYADPGRLVETLAPLLA